MNMLVNEIISWLNIGVLLVSTFLFAFLYIKSASPAALEKKIGEGAYAKCGRYRIIAGVFEMITIVNYFVYYLFPLSIPFLPQVLPWDWWISLVIAALILIFGLYWMFRGVKDAGAETMAPKKEHTMYGKIYEKMRHPQAVGEMILWFPFALFLNSPFLVLYSFIWIPVFYVMMKGEERDLVIRYGEPFKEYLKSTPFFISLRRGKRS
ncbi:MAG: methyltransferase [Promethearchaeota archaeon]